MISETLRFQGRLRDGATAAERPVVVERDGEDLVITGEDKVLRVTLAAVVADARLPGVPRMLALPDGARIETGDHAGVALLFPPKSRIDAAAFWLESRWAAALGTIPVIAGLTWLFVAIVLPLGAGPVAQMISPRIENAIGRQSLAALDRVALNPSAFRSGALGPNALALPGGIIIVTDDMVHLAPNEDELLAVLAHEIGHVQGRHALRLILQDSGVVVLIAALAGDAVSMSVLAAALPTALLQSHYSRQFEEEADEYAFAHLRRHGYSPQLFADMMRRLQQADRRPAGEGGVLRYFSTHPLTEERIQRAEAQR